MSKGLEVNAEIGLCTKDMAKENPIKDFEILIEEYKDKWSKQMYDYFKECLNEIKKEFKRLEELDNGAYVSIHINRYNELCDKEDALDIIKEIVKENVSDWGNIDFNINDYPLLKEALL